MNFLKNIIILLWALSANQVMAHRTPTLFSFEESASLSVGMKARHVSVRKSFLVSANKKALLNELSPSSAYYKQPFVRKQTTTSPGLITKLIRSNLKLSFRVSNTLNLTISYL